MPVIRESVGQRFATHAFQGSAISQAVAFVRTGAIGFQTVKEKRSIVRNDDDSRILQDIFHISQDGLPEIAPPGGEVIQVFR